MTVAEIERYGGRKSPCRWQSRSEIYILHKSNAYKHGGIAMVTVVMYLFLLLFRNRTLNMDMESDRKGCNFWRCSSRPANLFSS